MVALAQWLKVLLLCPHYTHLSRELNSFSSSEVIQKGLESVIYWLSLWPWSGFWSSLMCFSVYHKVVNCVLLFSKICSWNLNFLSSASATNSRCSIFSLSFTFYFLFLSSCFDFLFVPCVLGCSSQVLLVAFLCVKLKLGRFQ